MIVKANTVCNLLRAVFLAELKNDLRLDDRSVAAVRRSMLMGTALLVLADGVIVGGVGFDIVELPDEQGTVIVERLLYVVPDHRGERVAYDLLDALEEEGRTHNCVAVMAGSSLGHNEHTKRLYENRGYTTNLTFRKDLPCATH